MVHFGGYWFVLVGFGWCWLIGVGFGWLLLVLVGVASFWLVVVGFGWWWFVLVGIGWFWLVVVDFGWFKLVWICFGLPNQPKPNKVNQNRPKPTNINLISTKQEKSAKPDQTTNQIPTSLTASSEPMEKRRQRQSIQDLQLKPTVVSFGCLWLVLVGLAGHWLLVVGFGW